MTLLATLIRSEKPFLCSVIAIAIAWTIGLAFSLGIVGSGVANFNGSLLLSIGIGSGLVALMGGVPGLATELLPGIDESPGRHTIGFSAGVLIRLLGTVALVALCSYHMPAAKKEIAGMILAWYLYLTTVDVFVLATLLPRLDRPAVTKNYIAEHSNQ